MGKKVWYQYRHCANAQQQSWQQLKSRHPDAEQKYRSQVLPRAMSLKPSWALKHAPYPWPNHKQALLYRPCAQSKDHNGHRQQSCLVHRAHPSPTQIQSGCNNQVHELNVDWSCRECYLPWVMLAPHQNVWVILRPRNPITWVRLRSMLASLDF